MRRKQDWSPRQAAGVPCWVCDINPAVMKSYWEDDAGTSFKALSCGPCSTLNWKSVDKLMRAKPKRRRVLIKSWWDADSRDTTLPQAYPGVDWEQVDVDEDEEDAYNPD